MYRIIFNPKLAQWEVQLARFGVFWRRVDAGPFKDYDQAAAYVEQVGLSRVYRNWNDRPRLFGDQPNRVEDERWVRQGHQPPYRMPPPHGFSPVSVMDEGWRPEPPPARP